MMARYEIVRPISGRTGVIELTDAQARHPLYLNRVRRIDGPVKLEPATHPSDPADEAPKRRKQKQ